MKGITAIALGVLLFASCTTDEQRFNREIAEIEDYIATTGLDFTPLNRFCITTLQKRGI